MGEQFGNYGPATIAESARDVTSNGYIAREMLILNQGRTTNNFNGTNIVPPTLEPRISFKNIPEPHGSFTGRVEYIKSAIEYLSRPVDAELQIQFPFLVIHALGGYGKTQTARKISSVCRKERTFQHFIWIDSEDHQTIKKSFVAVMKQVGLNASVKIDALNFDLLMHQFYNLLASQKNDKFLIIFDNVEDFDNILKFLPLNRSASNLAVLMTSRCSFTRESYGHIRNQPLDLMLEEDAIQLVENILDTSTMDSDEDRKLLVEQSGRITLVLCVMTSTIKFQRRYKPDFRIKDYLQEMGDKPIKYSDKFNQLDLDYDKCLQKMVRFAVDKLNAGAPIQRIATNIFDRLVYLPSTNYLDKFFVLQYFRNICDDVKNADTHQLPIKPVDDVQVIRMAIEKLSEFSLAQIVGDELTVHRWIQASRCLDLKASGDGKAVLKEILFRNGEDDDFIVWQHVVDDYAELVNEFYVKRGTLNDFPIDDIDVLEKVIPILTQSADFRPFEIYAEDIEYVIERHILFHDLDSVKRVVNLFNYDMSKKSMQFLSDEDMSCVTSEVCKWLIDEKLLVPNENLLREYASGYEIQKQTESLRELRSLSSEITEKSSSGAEFEFDRSRLLRQPSVSNRIERVARRIELLNLVDSNPLKIHLCEIIEKYCGKDLLQEILRYSSESIDSRLHCGIIRVFEIIRIIRSSLKNLEPNIESDEISEIEMYTDNNMLECSFFCGITHFTKSYSYWRLEQRKAFKYTTHPVKLVDTLVMFAVKDGAWDYDYCLGNVNDVDDFGETALSYAIKICFPSICKYLLSCEATTSWKTKRGRSVHALHMAVKTFRDFDGSEPDEIIDAILTSNDCDVCAVDDLGNNILHLLVGNYYATRYKLNNNALQFILSACPHLVDMRNNEGFTPLQLAISLRDQFSHNHWHRANLQSFISMIEPIDMDGPDAERYIYPRVPKIPRYS